MGERICWKLKKTFSLMYHCLWLSNYLVLLLKKLSFMYEKKVYSIKCPLLYTHIHLLRTSAELKPHKCMFDVTKLNT